MKNNSLIYLVVFLLFIFLLSCDKGENERSGNIYQIWEVTDFISVESVVYPKDNNYNLDNSIEENKLKLIVSGWGWIELKVAK